MPAGQSFTTWFSELKNILKHQWKDDLSIQEHFELIEILNLKLTEIRDELNVKPPIIRCKNCNAKHEGKLVMVTITSMYYALERFEICSHEKHLELKRNWRKYSKNNSIDIHGKSKITKKEHESRTLHSCP